MSDWRQTPAYKRWRTRVFKRDGFKCVRCGSQENLVADHIKSGDQHPGLRYIVSNGRTLCAKCHAEIGTKAFHFQGDYEGLELLLLGSGFKKVVRVRGQGGSCYIPIPKEMLEAWTSGQLLSSDYIIVAPKELEGKAKKIILGEIDRDANENETE